MTIEISLKDIGMVFDNKPILNCLNLNVFQKDIHTIIGTTGSGKSVILKLISGMLTPVRGKVELQNKSLSFVFQDNPFLDWLSVEKNLQLSIGKNQSQIQTFIDRFHLHEYLSLTPKQLSGGTRQKFNLLRAFATHSDVILLDEPFSHLDQLQKDDLYNFTLSLWRETKPTIILVTHDIDEAIYLSHKISFLSKITGNITAGLNIRELSAPHASSILEEKSKESYFKLFDQVYSLYCKEGKR